jgi:small subunit ribosomal protein S9
MAVVNPFTWGLGRRKSAVARVRIQPGSGKFSVNGKDFKEFFVTNRDQQEATAPLTTLSSEESYDVAAQVDGGGPHGQAGAVRLGLARALKELNPALFETLRTGGHLTRDSRMKERKKYGRRGARRGFQFSKR